MSEAREILQRAYALRRRGEPQEALQAYREACAAFGSDREGRAHCLRHIGDLEMELGSREKARAALDEAEALYRNGVDDTLALANTLRLLALLDDNKSIWADARSHYIRAAALTGLDLEPAVAECDGHLR